MITEDTMDNYEEENAHSPSGGENKRKKDRRVKFESFTDRIKRIRIDLLPRGDLSQQVPSERETFFFEGVLKWRDLNLTADFSSYLSQVRDRIQTLPLLIHHREFLLEVTITAISEAAEISLEPILDLSVQLARDLQQEFSPHFSRLFSTLAARLTSKNPATLEQLFSCLSHLLKILWRHLVTEMALICSCYAPLLSNSRRDYVRRFAAESLSFLLRRSLTANQEFTLSALFKILSEDTADGMGCVLFEVMKSARPHFHSCTPSLLRALLGLLGTRAESNTSELTAFLPALRKTCELMVLHSNVDTAQECITITLDKLSESSDLSDTSLRGLVELISCWVGPDKCRLTSDSLDRCVTSLMGVCNGIRGRKYSWDRCIQVLLGLVRCNGKARLVETGELWCKVGEVLRSVNNREEWSVDVSCELVEGLVSQSVDLFSTNVLPLWVEFSEGVLTHSNATNTDRVLYTWTQVLGSVTEERGRGEKRVKLDSSDPFGATLLPLLLERSEVPFSRERAPYLSCLCIYTKGVVIPPENTIQCIEASLTQLYAMMTSPDETLLATLRDCVQALVRSRDLTTLLPHSQLTSLLSLSPNSPYLLQTTDTYTRNVTLPQETSEQIQTLIIPALSSPYSHVRTASLSILSSISPYKDILSTCVSVEMAPADLLHYKERLGHLRRLAHLSGSGRGQVEVEICLRILLSQFYQNFSPIWDQVRHLVNSYAAEETRSVFWNVVSVEIEKSLQSIEDYGTPLDISNTPNSVNKWFLSRENEEKKRRQEARVDLGNYSLQLWKTLLQISGYCESRSRTLVPILSQYLERWFIPADSLQDIAKRDETSEREVKPSSDPKNYKRKQIALSMLELFSHFKHTKSLYQADTLKNLYLRLLSHPLSEIQTSALSCLVSFQLPYLHTYIDQLTALAAERQLSTSLTLFSSEASEVCVLEQEHRSDVTPIISRLLYGILLRHGTSDRTSPSQTAILQFLASCSEDEVSTFLSLILSPLQPLIQGWTMDISEKSVLVIPLKKQISFLTLLKHLFFSLSTQIPDAYLAEIVTLLLNTCSQCISLLKNRATIQHWALPQVKQIRSLAIYRIIDVSVSFPNDVITSREESLFSCLISPTLTRSPTELTQGGPLLDLVSAWSCVNEFSPFFRRELGPGQVSLIGYVINTLGEKGVINRASDSILEVVSLLLQEDSDQLVAPYIHMVLRFISQVLTAARREKRPVSHHGREMEILSLASKWVGETEADVLTESLLFFLTSRGSRRDQIICDILTSVRNLVPLVQSPEKVSSKLCPLFSQLGVREERQELLAVFNALSLRLPYLELAVSISCKLNAWREDEIEELDYLSRGQGFSEARQGLKEGKFEEESLRMLAHNCIHFLFCCDEISLRDMSVHFLQDLIQWDYLDIYRGVIFRCVVSAVKRGVKSTRETTRAEAMGLLACVTKRFSHKDRFSELLTLTSKDREVDVFENIVHIQLHRRTTAVAKLTKLAEISTFSPMILREYLIPIVTHFLHCSQHDREHNLLTNAVHFMGRAAGQMGWGQYSRFLASYLRMVNNAACKLDESVIIRVVIAILQNFHFDASVREAVDNEIVSESESEQALDSAVKNPSQSIQDVMSKQILPQLEELLNTSPTGTKSGGHKLSHAAVSGCEIRAPIALALVQLLLKLTHQLFECHFQGILLKLVRALHCREWEQRQEVRRVLREVAVSVGAGCLRGMFFEMQQQLTRGFQVHVLVYSVHAVLEGVKRRLRPGDLDPCVPVLCELILNDLFGRPSEEREVREIAVKTLEVKHPKALDIVELLSSYISPAVFSSLLDPFVGKLTAAEGSVQVDKARDMLKRVAQGVLRNRAMTSQKLLLFVHQQLTASLSKESVRGVNESGILPSDTKYLGEVSRDCYLLQAKVERGGKKPQVRTAANIQVLTEFCLGLLSSALKADRKIDLRQQSVQEMLDPFVGTLSHLLPTPHLRISTLSVRILGQVAHLPLPSLKQHTEQLKSHLFSYLRKYRGVQRDADSPNSDMVSTSFRVLTCLLSQQKSVTFSKEEVQTLLLSVEEDIHHASRHETVFPLLKAIITRRIASKALYQVMQEVAKLCVQEEGEYGRKQARSCLILYLTEQPISRKKLKQCLDFVLSNLEYELEPGRQSAARLVTLILRKFPREILNDLAEYFYLPIALALANEESREAKRLFQLALKSLFSKVDSSRMSNIYLMGWGWVTGENCQFTYMGVSSLFVLIESGVRIVSKKIDAILKRLVRIVKLKGKETDSFSNKILLASVECLLKMVRIHGIEVICKKNTDSISDVIECCLPLVNAEEKEIRVITAKLFGTLFSQKKQRKHSSNISLFKDNGQLVNCAQTFVDRINSSKLDGDEPVQVVRNLIFLFGVLLKGEDVNTLKYLVRQMVKKSTLEAVLYPQHVIKRKSTYQLIAALAVSMDREMLNGSLVKFVKPLFYEVSRRNERGRRVRVLSEKQEELKVLAQDCLDIIKNKVGAELFNQQVLNLQKRAGEIRVKRKSVRSQLAATDAVKFANIKLRKYARQSLARKRKLASRGPFKYKLHQRKLCSIK